MRLPGQMRQLFDEHYDVDEHFDEHYLDFDDDAYVHTGFRTLHRRQ